MKIVLTRTCIYTILIGIFLSANSYGENMPVPIPIDLGEHSAMRGCSGGDFDGTCQAVEDCFSCPEDCGACCTNCHIGYDPSTMG